MLRFSFLFITRYHILSTTTEHLGWATLTKIRPTRLSGEEVR